MPLFPRMPLFFRLPLGVYHYFRKYYAKQIGILCRSEQRSAVSHIFAANPRLLNQLNGQSAEEILLFLDASTVFCYFCAQAYLSIILASLFCFPVPNFQICQICCQICLTCLSERYLYASFSSGLKESGS